MSKDGDDPKHDVPISPPIPPVDSTGEIPPTTNDVPPPPPPVNDEEPPVSTESDIPAATLPTQDSPGSSEALVAPPPPPQPLPVPSPDPQTSSDAPTPAPPSSSSSTPNLS